MSKLKSKDVYYSEYLALDKILDAQHPESDAAGKPAHDEMLFIITHQTYELWFKQILHELHSVNRIFSQEEIDDTGPELQKAVHRLNRVAEILRIAVEQISIMETMTPMDFMEFRDLLRPASGFQSVQFKLIEAALGLSLDNRHGQAYYRSQLKESDLSHIKEAEKSPSFIHHLNQWLERAPFWADEQYWQNYSCKFPDMQSDERHIFWTDYKALYQQGLAEGEQQNMKGFEQTLFGSEDTDRKLSAQASRSALFIILYRDYPLLQVPFQLLQSLLEIDEMMARWRFRHYNMVKRMIGSRIGTGGSTGQNYLFGALQKHYIFQEISGLTSYLTKREDLPTLSPELQNALSVRT